MGEVAQFAVLVEHAGGEVAVHGAAGGGGLGLLITIVLYLIGGTGALGPGVTAEWAARTWRRACAGRAHRGTAAP